MYTSGNQNAELDEDGPSKQYKQGVFSLKYQKQQDAGVGGNPDSNQDIPCFFPSSTP